MRRNKTVLIISDSHEQFSLAASLLRGDGYRVLFERDISQSLEIAKTEFPELIISELAVPNIDGIELCCRVRDDTKLGSTPVLLVGDLSNKSSIVGDSFRCGAADYLQKPIDQHKLFDLCRGMSGPAKNDVSYDRSENLFNSLMENISDVITIIAADGTILFESSSTKRILGYEPNELLGKNTFDLVHPNDVNQAMEYFNLVRNEVGYLPPIDFRFRQKDESWKIMTAVGKPIDDPRFELAVVVTLSEVTRPASTANRAFPMANNDTSPLNIKRWKVDNSLISEN